MAQTANSKRQGKAEVKEKLLVPGGVCSGNYLVPGPKPDHRLEAQNRNSIILDLKTLYIHRDTNTVIFE